MPRGQYVFFDVDHTLVQWLISWPDAFVAAACRAGVSATPRQAVDALHVAYSGSHYGDCIRSHYRSGDEEAFWLEYDGHVLSLMGVRDGLDRAARHVIEALERPGAAHLYPEVPGVLESLSTSGVWLGVITNRPRAEPYLSDFGISGYFRRVVDAFSTGCSKRDGVMFDTAAQAAREADRTGWHVGDSYSEDVEGARAAGLRAVLVDREGKREDSDCLRVTDLRELLQVLAVGEKERRE